MRNVEAKRWQFSLRTFLIVALCLGALPWAVQHYRKWRSANLWSNLEAANSERDQVNQLWRQAYSQMKSTEDARSRTQEQAVRQQYFTAHDKVVVAKKNLDDFYGVEGIREIRVVYRNGEKCLIPNEAMP